MIINVLKLYGASALVFLGVIARDFIWKIYFPNEIAIIFQSITLATGFCMIPVNWLLFGNLNIERLRVINIIIIISFFAVIFIELDDKIRYTFLLIIQMIASGVLGRLLYVKRRLFYFRSRDFISSILGIVLAVLGCSFFVSICLGVLLVMTLSIGLYLCAANDLEKSLIRSLSVAESFAVILPSIIFMSLIYCLYEYGFVDALAYELRFATYANSVCLVGIPVMPLMGKTTIRLFAKVMFAALCILMLLILVSYLLKYWLLLFVFLGLIFGAMSYYCLAIICLQNERIS